MAEEALQEAKDHAERLIELASIMVVGLDCDGRVRAFNRVWDFDGRSAEICRISWRGP